MKVVILGFFLFLTIYIQVANTGSSSYDSSISTLISVPPSTTEFEDEHKIIEDQINDEEIRKRDEENRKRDEEEQKRDEEDQKRDEEDQKLHEENKIRHEENRKRDEDNQKHDDDLKREHDHKRDLERGNRSELENNGVDRRRRNDNYKH